MCIFLTGETLARNFTKHGSEWKCRNPAPGLLCAEEHVVCGQGNGGESDRGTDAGSPNGPVNPGGPPKGSGQEVCRFLSRDLCAIRAHQTQGMSTIEIKQQFIFFNTVPKSWTTPVSVQ